LNRGNAFGGIHVLGSMGNQIGGTNVSDRNIISANAVSGMFLDGAGGTLVQGNYIGTGIGGGGRLSNGNHGIVVSGGATNMIGGTSVGAKNLISGNTDSGIFLSGASTIGTVIQGNYIGTDFSGSSVVSNGGYGVSIVGAVSSAVGGTNAGAGNLISGNGRAGVDLNGNGTANNMIQGNLIGTDVTGKLNVGNTLAGISMSGATGTLIGGVVPEARNIIAGNKQDGILIYSNAVRSFIQGNFLGVDVTGTNALANAFNGISIVGAISNVIGGTISGARNVISGNANYGLQFSSGATGNSVLGNYVGPDATGLVARANQLSGIRIETSGNIIGGAGASGRNVISGNGQDGIFLVGLAATANVIQGNYIGTKPSGSGALGNGRAGIGISGAPTNLIGGAASGAGNVIAANGDAGIYLVTAGSAGNQLQGNFIGTDATGTSAMGNAQEGIYMDHASANVIGGAASGAGNLISGNSTWGLYLTNNSSGNVFKGNLIGTTIDGTSALGNGYSFGGFHAFELRAACNNNIIGGSEPGAANHIAFAPVLSGIYYAGIRMRDGATGNLISQNATFSNGGLGIDLSTYLVSANDACDADSGANNLQNYPVLTQAVTGSGTGVRGTLNSTAGMTFRLEFFANPACDFLLNGEGQIYLGNAMVTTSNNCNASFVALLSGSVPVGYVITATATDPANNTSEFSACAPVSSSPTLAAAAPTNNQMRLSWTNTTSGFVLKQTDSLNPPIQWTTATNAPVNLNGQFVVTQTMTTSNRFFLLSFE
jgi:hypothetical protein